MRRSAFACVGPAWNRMVETCFRPFRFGIWARLALIAFLAGEMGGGGGNFGRIGRATSSRGSGGPRWHPDAHSLHLLVTIGAAVFVVGLVLVLLFLYLNARARFVLMNSVIERTCRLGDMWTRWRENAKPYFVFNLSLALITLTVTLLLGIQVVRAMIAAGVFRGARVDVFALFSGVVGFLLFAVFVWLVAAVIQVFAKDFLVPVLGLERPTLGSAWERLRGIMSAEPSEFVVYIVAKIVLTILAIAAMTIVMVFCVVFLIVPVAVVVGVGAALLKLNVLAGIVAGIAMAIVIVPVVLFVFAFVHVPFAVFFEAFALEFFADRFPPLAAVLYPAPPIPAAPMNTVPEPAI